MTEVDLRLDARWLIPIVPAGTLHMHGATDDGPICQLSLLAPGPTDWDPPVPDEWRQYAQSQ